MNWKFGERCCICGLRIPKGIANPAHPLANTREHLVPKSRGGHGERTDPNNVARAHGVCNQAKRDRMLTELSQSWFYGIQGRVCIHLKELGVLVSEEMLKEARNHIQLRQANARISALNRHLYSWHRWEDDGGAVIPNYYVDK